MVKIDKKNAVLNRTEILQQCTPKCIENKETGPLPSNCAIMFPICLQRALELEPEEIFDLIQESCGPYKKIEL